MTDKDQTIYKIVQANVWREAERKGRFEGAGVDLSDGFIHFSTVEQVRETAAKHYAWQDDLLLVAVDGAALNGEAGEAFRYEPSRGGAMFPHLYAPLPMTAVLGVNPLPLRGDGTHEFPEL